MSEGQETCPQAQPVLGVETSQASRMQRMKSAEKRGVKVVDGWMWCLQAPRVSGEVVDGHRKGSEQALFHLKEKVYSR